MVATGLVGSAKQLDLEVVGHIRPYGNRDGQAMCQGRHTGCGAGCGAGRHAGCHAGRWSECFGYWHLSSLHVPEVDLPGHVDAVGVLFPLDVHLVDVAGRTSGEEVVTGVRRSRVASFCEAWQPAGGGGDDWTGREGSKRTGASSPSQGAASLESGSSKHLEKDTGVNKMRLGLSFRAAHEMNWLGEFAWYKLKTDKFGRDVAVDGYQDLPGG